MPEELWIYLITLLASVITLISGFGLGTILTPAFALFYDVKLAILLVAIVHIFNNIFKFFLFRRDVDIVILRRFGMLSVVGAIAGALLQGSLHAGTVKILLGILLVILGTLEFLPHKASYRLPRSIDVSAGFFSGFLGGLVGNQGAIRSAYLLNYELSKEAFIGTATVIALLIDATRIPIYFTTHTEYLAGVRFELLLVVVVAFLGTFIGKKFLKQISTELFKKIVALFVILMGIAFICGIV